MKALAANPGSRSLGLVERPVPGLVTGDMVLARMLDVGICGTDREIARFGYGTPSSGENSLVIGHESLAEVVETGSKVQRLAAGDLVVIMGASAVRRSRPRALPRSAGPTSASPAATSSRPPAASRSC